MHLRPRWFARSAGGLALILLVVSAARAQTGIPSRVVRLQVDNDAFDFWMPAWDRPDEEYTSGVRLSLETERAPWWSRRVVSPAGSCTSEARHCVVASDAIGQDMYTPERHIGDSLPPPGSRPNAGWLYYESAVRVVGNASQSALSIAVGTTGGPALARQTQSFFHMLAARYNRPIDWSHQIPFSPGLIVRYDWAARFGVGERSGTSRALGAELQPRVSLSAGNIITQAEGGARIRAGFGMANPWIPAASNAPIRFDVLAGASMRAVGYNAFLDGTMFRDSPSVPPRPFVSERELAAELSFRRIGLEYRAVTTGPEYRPRTASHPWASMIGEWRF